MQERLVKLMFAFAFDRDDGVGSTGKRITMSGFPMAFGGDGDFEVLRFAS